jgi:hypothetical protein
MCEVLWTFKERFVRPVRPKKQGLEGVWRVAGAFWPASAPRLPQIRKTNTRLSNGRSKPPGWFYPCARSKGEKPSAAWSSSG